MIEKATAPHTVASLVDDLRGLGVRAGQVLLVHTSLRAIGWVSGAAHAVVLALLEAVRANAPNGGTIVFPTQTGMDDPKNWRHPPVPEEWCRTIRESLPAYDSRWSPTRGMGAVVEAFRTHPEARRSAHPTWSFAAIGPRSEDLLAAHDLADGLGPGSPLGRLHEEDALVMQVGTDHTSNTTLHLAEYAAEWAGKRTRRYGAPMSVDGQSRWVEFEDLEFFEDDFAAAGAAFEAARPEAIRRGTIGNAPTMLWRMRDLVSFVAPWMSRHRQSIAGG